MRAELRKRLFAIQQRVAITNGEALALLGFTAILAIGLLIGHFGGGAGEVDTSAYASLAESFEAGAALSVEEARAALSGDTAAALTPAAPSRETVAATPVSRAPVRLDPNTASSQALQRLPGIGPALAQRIIDYREQVGPFRAPRDLMAVRGIGPRTFERMEPYLFVPSSAEVGETSQSERGGGVTASGSVDAPSPP